MFVPPVGGGMEIDMKETGILLPVASLPSKWGVGDLGREAYAFVDMLSEAGCGIWQILPMNPLGYGNSPYQPYSSFAGDELYISLEELDSSFTACEQGDLETQCHIDYDKARACKEPYLRKAFEAFVSTPEYEQFAAQAWVEEYSVYRAFKKANGNSYWNSGQWPQWQMFWPERREGDLTGFEQEIRFQSFLQYTFYSQWMRLKEYANEKGVRIMGDVPFYVGLDSQDVWAGKKNFLLDAEGNPAFIAGVPPDYFSATGQRWGNPIYDWEYIKADGYRFWTERIGSSGKLFDIVRIDHFRAFDTYWKIPSSCPTAIEGEWVEAPGYEALDAILQANPKLTLVAEDLGLLRPEVYALKDHYGLKGMKILEFTLNTDGKRARDEFKDVDNIIIYTGTHDNDTISSWYRGLGTARRRKLRRFLKEHGCGNGSVEQRLLAYALRSRAQWAILPMADVLELGQGARLNTPGTVGSPNWEWKMTDFDGVGEKLKRVVRYRR